MEFIKKMKKREFIEMGLKAGIIILSAFLAIILMEGMIYGIHINALTKHTNSVATTESTIAYCIKQGNNKYFVIYYDENGTSLNEKGELIYWSARSEGTYSKSECEKIPAKEIIYHAPNAFDLSITPKHFIAIGIFVAAVAGFIVWRFIVLANTYKKIEEKYKKDGIIELGSI